MIVIGIDLGTSNSTLSYFDKKNNYKIIRDNDMVIFLVIKLKALKITMFLFQILND